jgi:2-polyprenyl-6-methoxyphenol hydroxylase-like FAD-dependent oxidoreductase
MSSFTFSYFHMNRFFFLSARLQCSRTLDGRTFLNIIPFTQTLTPGIVSNVQVKCSQYHDTKGLAVLMGDAAHASGPNIGQGVNISLGDAAALASLLLEMVRRLRVIRNQLL